MGTKSAVQWRVFTRVLMNALIVGTLDPYMGISTQIIEWTMDCSIKFASIFLSGLLKKEGNVNRDNCRRVMYAYGKVAQVTPVTVVTREQRVCHHWFGRAL